MKTSCQPRVNALIILALIILTLFSLNTAGVEAQLLPPFQSDVLALLAFQAMSSSIAAYPAGIPLYVPYENAFASRAVNAAFYPNATYLNHALVPNNSVTQYIPNATGFYSIESSSSCTCNLP
jgi:hypothetical protein